MNFLSLSTGRKGPSSNRSQSLGMRLLASAAVVALAAPASALACACGCGIYEVGTAAMLPSMAGKMLTFDYDYQDQNQNWGGSSQAPAADNPDKDIRTSWLSLDYQDMLNRQWGFEVELPFEQRHFVTTGGASGSDIVGINYSGVGDVRLQGIYTGFSSDMSDGVTFGLKLPTGSFKQEDAYGDIDRDTEIGSGSTDILLGGFSRADLGNAWQAVTQALLDVPVLSQVQYRPGVEFDLSTGAYYTGFRLGGATVSPVAMLKVSVRSRDTGANSADPVASGFQRILASPGVEVDLGRARAYADVEIPLYYHFTGYQMAPKALFRASVSYMF